MSFTLVFRLAGALLVNVCAAAALAADATQFLTSAYPGAHIGNQTTNNYVADFALLHSTPEAVADAVQVKQLKKISGSLTVTQFDHRPDDSEVEIFASYRNALTAAGYQLDFICPPGCLANDNHWWNVVDRYQPQLADQPKPIVNIGYIAASKGSAHVSLLTGATVPGEGPISLLAVLMAKPQDDRGVKVNPNFATAEAIGQAIASEGKVALYGIYFDSGKAELKPESLPLLAEIARLLTKTPQLKLYVVGHTDDSGDYQHNITLSAQRAAAVVTYLVKAAGIDASRLLAQGVGPLAPLASNSADSGRKLNRRVELISRLQ